MTKNYFTIHLDDAIVINTQRKIQYAALTKGKSLRYSRKLIFLERLTKVVAWYYDRQTYPFQKMGIPVGKFEFVNMHEIPAFSATYPTDIEVFDKLPEFDYQAQIQSLKSSFQTKSYPKLIKHGQIILHALNPYAAHFILYRHLIESIIRFCQMSLIHQTKMKDEHLKLRLFKLNHWLIRMHLLVLKRSYQFDQEVFEIQTKGIPFLYQDIPSIHVLDSLEVYPEQ